MNENVLDKLKRMAKDLKKLKRKGESARRKIIIKKITKHVQLTRAIYIEPLASQKPIEEEHTTFEQQEISRKLDKKLEVDFQFFNKLLPLLHQHM